jgi:hypothetical protein
MRGGGGAERGLAPSPAGPSGGPAARCAWCPPPRTALVGQNTVRPVGSALSAVARALQVDRSAVVTRGAACAAARDAPADSGAVGGAVGEVAGAQGACERPRSAAIGVRKATHQDVAAPPARAAAGARPDRAEPRIEARAIPKRHGAPAPGPGLTQGQARDQAEDPHGCFSLFRGWYWSRVDFMGAKDCIGAPQPRGPAKWVAAAAPAPASPVPVSPVPVGDPRVRESRWAPCFGLLVCGPCLLPLATLPRRSLRARRGASPPAGACPGVRTAHALHAPLPQGQAPPRADSAHLADPRAMQLHTPHSSTRATAPRAPRPHPRHSPTRATAPRAPQPHVCHSRPAARPAARITVQRCAVQG